MTVHYYCDACGNLSDWNDELQDGGVCGMEDESPGGMRIIQCKGKLVRIYTQADMAGAFEDGAKGPWYDRMRDNPYIPIEDAIEHARGRS